MGDKLAVGDNAERGGSWLKWTLIGLASLAGLVVLGLLAVYILLLTYDFDALKPRLAAAVRQATGRELTLGGRIRLTVSPMPRLQVEELALGNPAWCSRPRMLAARRGLVVVDLWPLLRERRLVVRRLRLEGLELNLERDAQGRTNLDFAPQAPATAPVPATGGGASEEESALRLSFRVVEVDEASLRWLDHAAAGERILDVAHLRLDHAGGGQPLRVTASGSLGGRPWQVRGDLAEPAEGGGKMVGLELGWGGAGLVAAGRVADPANLRGLDLQVDLRLPDPAALGLGGPPGPWRVKGRLLNPAIGAWRLDPCAVEAADSALMGWVELVSGGERPKLSGELQANKLDFTVWNPGPTQPGADKPRPRPAPGSGEARVFSSEPLPLGWLDQVDVHLGFKAGQFRAPGLVWQDLDLNLRLAGGHLSLAPLSAKWSGGQLGLKLNLTPAAKGHAVTLDLSLRGSQLGPILRQAEVRETLEGEMEAGAELRGQGESVAAIMAHLNGKSWQVLRRGRLHQRLFAILGGDLAGGLTSALGGVFGGRDYSEVNCLVLGLMVKDGLATTTALALDSDRMVLLGRGKLDLKTERLEVAANPQAKNTLTTPGGMGLNLSELAKPFKLTGTLAKPRMSLDTAEVLATLGKSLGGMALMGPAGLAAGLATADGEPSGMCQEALAAARKGEVYQPKGGGVSEPVKKAGEGIGGAINKFFGR